MSALCRIIRYIQGTSSHGLQIFKSKFTTLTAYSDVDWPGAVIHDGLHPAMMFTSVTIWSHGRQSVNKQHRGPAEYKGIANAVVEICFLCNPLLELHCPLSTSTLVFCEDISSVYLSTYEAYSGKKMAMEQVKVLHVPASLQYADIFTKRLPTSLFIDFKSILTVCCTNYLTTGGWKNMLIFLLDLVFSYIFLLHLFSPVLEIS